MGRLLSGFLLVAAIVGLASPWAMGLLSERVYASALDELTRQAGGWEAQNLAWERGYRHSQSRTRLTMPLGLGEVLDERFSVELVTDYHHGLTGVTATTRVAEESVPEWQAVFPEEQPVLRTRAQLNGRVQGHLNVPAFDWQGRVEGEAIETRSERLRAEGDWRPSGQLQFDLDWQALQLALGERAFALHGLNVRHLGQPYGRSLWLGDSRIALASLSWDDGQRPELRMESARVEASARENDGYYDASLLLAVDSLTENGEGRGEQRLGFAVNDFHGDSLDRIVVALTNWYRLEDNQSVVARAGAEMTLYQELSDAVQQLSVHGGQLRVEPVVFNNAYGRMDGHLRIDYPRLPRAERSHSVSLVEHGEGEAQVVLDDTLLSNLPDGLQPWLGWIHREGWLVRDNNRYVLDIALRDRAIHYGDNVWELPPLL